MLAPLGVTCVPWVWSRPRPSGIDAVLVRSCWDYHEATAAFVAWIATLEADATPLANAPAILRWNLHKGYLLELATHGVAIPDTRLVKRGDDARAVSALAPGPLVVKPAVSMGGWETHRFAEADRGAAAACVERLAIAGDVLVQAYRPEIEAGEISIILVGGEPSHAIRKRPAAGEFRVHAEYGGTRELTIADPTWVAEARRIAALAPEMPLIARVDGVIVDGRFVLMELEAIDPMLFLAWTTTDRTERLAAAIRAWLGRSLPAT